MSRKVKIYTDPRCPACALAKEYLRLSGIEYEERSISEIPPSECGVTPVLEVGGKRYCGLTKEALEALDGR